MTLVSVKADSPTQNVVFLKGNAALNASAISGTGVENDPYILSFNFANSTETQPLVHINSTDAYVVIKDTILIGGSIGIFLENATNVRMQNVTIMNSIRGVFLKFSNKVAINNTIMKGVQWGLDARYSNEVNLTESYILDCILRSAIVEDRNDVSYTVGLHLTSTNNTKILKNTIGGSSFPNEIKTNTWNVTISMNNFIDYGGHNLIGSFDPSNGDIIFDSNFWNLYTAADANNDGVYDTAVTLKAGVTDQSPRVNPYVTVLDILTKPVLSTIDQYNAQSGNYTLNWTRAFDTQNHSIQYSLSISSDAINWTILAQGITATQYIWNTAQNSNGTYQIRVTANCTGSIVRHSAAQNITIANAPAKIDVAPEKDGIDGTPVFLLVMAMGIGLVFIIKSKKH